MSVCICLPPLKMSRRRCGSNLRVALLNGSMTGFCLTVRPASHRWRSAVPSHCHFWTWRVPSECGSSDAMGTGPLMAARRRVPRGNAGNQPWDKCEFGRIATTKVAVRRDGKRRKRRLRATFYGRRVRRWRWTDIGDGRSRRCGGVTKAPRLLVSPGGFGPEPQEESAQDDAGLAWRAMVTRWESRLRRNAVYFCFKRHRLLYPTAPVSNGSDSPWSLKSVLP